MPVPVPFLLALVAGLPTSEASDAVPYPNGRRVRAPATQVRDDEIRIDGRVDEAAWKSVPALPELIQIAPRFGARPTHETDVRIAYGKRGLYAAFVCYDDPEHVRGAVARKDQIPASDRVSLKVDPNHDHVSGYHFEVNPSGALSDSQVSRDGHYERLWDGVWQAAARKHEHGWSAEIFIPWSTIRFERRESYTFGIHVGRWINHDAERHVLSPTPQGLPGVMSWASDYEGVEGVTPGLNFELRPYVSGRFAVRRPPGGLDHSPRALPNTGFEAKYGVFGNLTLDLAVNPDFGQAEVDPAVLNLSPFEVFFPERRQLFLEAKEIFETRFRLFYSRRVGNNPSPDRADIDTRIVHGEEDEGELVELEHQTRILEALRLTGEPTPGWSVGALTATTSPTFGVQRFSDGVENPVTVDPVTQWTVLRVRRQYDSQADIGAIATSVVRGAGEPDAFTGGVDYRLRFRRHWRHALQVIGTHDGEDAGMGASGDLARTSKNTSIAFWSEMLTPTADFNDIGYMRSADKVDGDGELRVFNAQPIGKLRRIEGKLHLGTGTNFDGLLTRASIRPDASIETQRLWRVAAFGGVNLPHMDPYETRGDIPYRVPLHWWVGGDFRTPYNKRAVLRIHGDWGVQEGIGGPDAKLNLDTRPADRLQLGLVVDFDSNLGRPRWVVESDTGEPVFGRADVFKTEVALRGTLGITPALTVQTFNQLLYNTAHHDEFYVLTDPATLVSTNPEPYTGEVDQSLTAFTSNTIARWEYLPGSALFLVYTHRSVLDGSGELIEFHPGDAFSNLTALGVEHEDIIFVKLVHLFAF